MQRLLRYVNVSDHVQRTLTFHNAVTDNLRSRYKKCKTKTEQRRIRRLIMCRTIRQCKMQMFCRDVFGFSSRAKVERAVKSTELPVAANENEQSSCGSKPRCSSFLVPLPQRQTRKIVKRKK